METSLTNESAPNSNNNLPTAIEMDSSHQAGAESSQSNQAMVEQNSQTLHICPDCNKVFTAKRNLIRHSKIHLGIKKFECKTCGKKFTRKGDHQRHLLQHVNIPSGHAKSKVVDVESKEAISKRVVKPMQTLDTFSVYNFYPTKESEGDLHIFIEELRPPLHQELEDHVDGHGAMKWYGTMVCHLTRPGEDGEDIKHTVFLNCTSQILLHSGPVADQIDTAFSEIIKRLEKFTCLGSGWILEKVGKFELSLARYQPLAKYRRSK